MGTNVTSLNEISKEYSNSSTAVAKKLVLAMAN
jgi:hypothetical protein